MRRIQALWNVSERTAGLYRDARFRRVTPTVFVLWAASSSLIFSRRRSVTSRRNREFLSRSSAIRSPPPGVQSGPSASCAGRGAGGALRHRCKVMTLTPSVRTISVCSFPCLAKSFACASFVATSTLECRFCLAIAASPQPPIFISSTCF